MNTKKNALTRVKQRKNIPIM